MQTLITILNYVGPFAGVVLGWILSTQAEKARVAREDRKKLKKTLYHLLELQYRFKMYEADGMKMGMIKKVLSDKLKVLPGFQPEFIDQMIKMVIERFRADGSIVTESQVEELNNNFMVSVEDLAEVDPELAFRLNGKQNASMISGLLKSSMIGMTADMAGVDEAM